MAKRAVARKVDEAATGVRVMVETLAEKEAERVVVARVVKAGGGPEAEAEAGRGSDAAGESPRSRTARAS